ncbi:MAG: hypothetical protein LBB41_02465 [Prevotellaceae bacterium]|jgi:hypothetical protein|nr:hypothetical protein [Prevotellaceae bacterium]
MRKYFLILIAVIGFGISANAHFAGTPANLEGTPFNVAIQAAINVNLDVTELIPDASYYLKITKNGEIAYAPVSSCQMALEKTYDLLQSQGVNSVRIVSESPTLNGSCRNRTYTKRDLNEVQKRRDGYSGGF